MGEFPRLGIRPTENVHTHRPLFELSLEVQELLGELKDTISRNKLARQEKRDLFMMVMTTHLELTFISILRCAAEGHVGDAFALLRVSLELQYQIAYMRTDLDVLADQWMEFESVARLSKLRSFVRAGGATDEESIKAVDRIHAEHPAAVERFVKKRADSILEWEFYPNWTKLTVRDMCEKSGLLRDYLTVYNKLSDYVHPNSSIMGRYLLMKDNGDLQISPNLALQSSEANLLFFSAIHVLLSGVEMLAEHFKIDLPSTYADLRERWDNLEI